MSSAGDDRGRVCTGRCRYRPFRPEHPLNDEVQWQSTNRDNASGDLSMDPLNADIFCQKIEAVCNALGYKKKTRAQNLAHLRTLVAVRKS